MLVLSVQCPGGVGLLETVFLIVIVRFAQKCEPQDKTIYPLCIVPCVVCVHLLGLVGHL